MRMPVIRASQPGDLAAVLELLKEEHLPTAGVPNHFVSYIVATDGGRIVGSIGLELYGETALLRSAVVSAERRSIGLGTELLKEILKTARRGGVKRVLLLTATAERFFGTRGFRAVDRASVTGPVVFSEEFTGACPSTARCMELTL
jgi:N-acetylglutamate synthase-like GNAT family acetyltransferase